MKFEQLLKIYWSRGFLYGGKAESFNLTLNEFFENKPGLSTKSQQLFIKRFELIHFKKKKNTTFLKLNLDRRKIINMYLSQIISINNSIFELIKYNLIRLYLIKTFRGKCQALGKPSRGQRTWSNAWNAHKCNIILKNFVNEVKKFNVIEKKTESLNRKWVKKKLKIKAPKIKMIFTKKKRNFWF